MQAAIAKQLEYRTRLSFSVQQHTDYRQE